LTLAGSWESYVGTRSGNFRKHLKKYARGLEALGPVTIARLEPGDDCAAWMSEIVEVNRSSWTAQRGTDLFRHPRLRAFFAEVVPALASRGWIDLHVLRVAGRVMAYELCFDLGNRIFSYNGSYRPEIAKHSPGTLLTAAVIESAFRRGRDEYDMLRGEESYKRRWSDARRIELEIVRPAARWRAEVYARFGPRLKARIKSSPRVRALVDRTFGLLARFRHRARSQ
jgi:CelD/BcsL family acetyltransferase involved in cellulose biosynthesis